MAGNIFSSFSISAQGLALQRQRLSSIAKNIANADATRGPTGEPYRREIVVARAHPADAFEEALGTQLRVQQTAPGHAPTIVPPHRWQPPRVLSAVAMPDPSPFRIVYDPSHPDADAQGYVRYPNVNIVTEMIELISAQRAFEANTAVLDAAKNIARDSLEI
ncbi:MAG: flagellar basal body rod protein FlgC [Candidatus Kapabacteria bacterium]|nr:flagellar basal body rod protein FlgC [Candidatus Kapabacteria bacterium]MDW7997551.1 flagellar basal body rod protein FlgC [Bacteroidota bacterium]